MQRQLGSQDTVTRKLVNVVRLPLSCYLLADEHGRATEGFPGASGWQDAGILGYWVTEIFGLFHWAALVCFQADMESGTDGIPLAVLLSYCTKITSFSYSSSKEVRPALMALPLPTTNPIIWARLADSNQRRLLYGASWWGFETRSPEC